MRGLDVGGPTLGLVADAEAQAGHGRILLSIDVPDVDAARGRVEGLGGTVGGPANDMPRGSGSRTSRTRTGSPST